MNAVVVDSMFRSGALQKLGGFDLSPWMKLPNASIKRVLKTFKNVALGDPRRGRRLQKVVSKLAKRPNASFPDAMESDAELDGAYLFANNKAVDPKQMLDSVAAATVERARVADSVLVIHDTTSASFPHADPKEVGYLSTHKPGFYIHYALVLDDNAWRRPLGVVHLETIVRKQPSKRGRKSKASGAETAGWKDRESGRWDRCVDASAKALAQCKEVIHVADREGDSYAFLASMVAQNRSFVVRVNHNRKVGDPEDLSQQWMPLKEQVRCLEGTLERDVELSARKPSQAPRDAKAHPARKARVARLQFAATTVVLKRPRYLAEPVQKTLTLNVVHVSEPNPPPGEPSVEWLLFTTLPVNSNKQITRVVDIYRARWTIEEMNKAIKTGCAYEGREFRSLHALLIVLAMTLPIACELLWLRSRARDISAPATDVLTPQQLKILRKMATRPVPARATARQALYALAGIGGHARRNGEPGWIVLHRGMQKLLAYEEAYEAGYSAAKRSRAG